MKAWTPVPQVVGIIGLGKLGSALGLKLRDRGFRVLGSVKSPKSRERLTKMGFEVHLDNNVVVSKSDVVILSVKPYNVEEISVKTEKPLISFVAGVPLSKLSAFSNRPFRAMTNVALTTIAVTGPYDEQIDGLLKAISPRVIWVDEKLIDPLTVVLGSGPALVAKLLDSFVRASVDIGVPWDIAKEVADELFRYVPLLMRQRSPEELVEMIATPGGTTIKALVEMAEIERVMASAFEGAMARLVPKR
ncbi:pyrroline-5-carboxylate reductase family protein [Thermoproteus tenax]|uniref:Pyrroline-5-carboxylate reductase n=1 Tax=Thermoproteus tenax (strain ATCC 35583 / DSM 2078 / JCM 9277 / NBRC 100435 / Kra 1) TaxID=768679 RepID=G4RLA6_THETK|nr:pyrroline-5-carboxylate reductase dimerization domain-containing protein [Thermoproteus tenax]CCC82351.1 Pyrroline-5-carboxylate reductase [Thermoproteus tenax Kra 1]